MQVVRVTESVRRNGFTEQISADGGSLTEALKVLLDRSGSVKSRQIDQAWLTSLWNELITAKTAERDGRTYTWRWL